MTGYPIAAWFGGGPGGPNATGPSFWDLGHTMADIPLSQINYLLAYGSDVASASDPTVNVWSYTDAHMAAIVSACHAVGCKVLLVLGDANRLHSILANSTYRSQLVTNYVNKISQYGVDGLYIDWEPDAGIQSGDIANMDSFLAALYAALHPSGKIIAITTGGNVSNAQFSASSCQYLEFIDFETYFARHDVPNDADGEMAAVATWTAAGYDHTKFLLDVSAWVSDQAGNNWVASYADVIAQYNPAPSVYNLAVRTINSTFYGNGYTESNKLTNLIFQNRAVAQQLADKVRAMGYKGMYLFEIENDLLSGNSLSLLNTIYQELRAGQSGIQILAGANVKNVALVRTIQNLLSIVNYGWNTAATDAAVLSTVPKGGKITINNSSVGPWHGNANIATFMNGGIDYFEYLDGGYEGTQARSIPNDLQSNINFMVAAKNAGAKGIFLDEVSTNPNAASISYLTAIHNEALLLGLKTIFNTGYYTFNAAALKNLTDYLMADEDYTGTAPTASEVAFGVSRILAVSDQVTDPNGAAKAISITEAGWNYGFITWCTDSVSYALPSYMAAYIAGLG